MDAESRIVLRKICIDVFVLLCMAFPLLAMSLWATPHRRGYFPADRALALPYRGSTVTTLTLALVGFALVLVTVSLVEMFGSRRDLIVARRRLAGWSVPAWAWDVYQLLGICLFGALCQQLTTTLGKYTVGRLRPHFFDVCNPEPTDPTALLNGSYVELYTCRGTDTSLLLDMRLSFPSAHASFSAYIAIFFAIYLHTRFTWGSLLLRHGLQLLALLAAWYTGLSRIVDNKHHASDVAVGFFIGAVYAALVFVFVAHPGSRSRRSRFNHKRPSTEVRELPRLPTTVL